MRDGRGERLRIRSSASPAQEGSMSNDALPGVLQVEEISQGRYRVEHPAEDPEARNVVFSGQILAQMIMASDHVIPWSSLMRA